MLTGVTTGAGPSSRFVRALAAAAVLSLVAGCAPGPRSRATTDPPSWTATVRRSIDDATLADAGILLPEGANVFAARIFDGPSPAYAFFEAGGGAFSRNFFPASTVKLLASLGALDFLAGWGLTGDAVLDGGYTVREYYDAALRWSSNEDYDALVRIAGVDWLNRRFLPDNGFGSTAIQEPYGADEQVTHSPEMVLTEGGRDVVLPEREGDADYGCEGGNCADLFELADAMRRVVLADELPAGERFPIAPADVAALRDALQAAEGFIAPGVEEALGPDVQLYTKPGWVPGLDCVETSVVDDPAAGRRFLLALSAPDADGCDMLAPMARDVLSVLAACDDTIAERADGSLVDVAGGRQTTAKVDAGAPGGCRRR